MSALLPMADLTWMRAEQARAMPGTVVIERAVYTPDGMGGYAEAWAAVGTVTGRIYLRASRSGAEQVTGGQVVSMTRWYATLPVGTDVTAKDRLLYQTRTWEVRTVNNDEMYQTAVRCELEAYNEERRT